MKLRVGRKLAGLSLSLGLAAGLSACSSLPSVPDWVDPTTWFGGSSKTADDSGLSKAGEEAQNQQAAGQTPDLADVPQKPSQSDASQNTDVAGSLASDRAQANYSADALRGGTEAAAPPPPAAAPTDQQVAEVATTPSAAPADDNAAAPAADTSAPAPADASTPAAPAQPAAAAPPSDDQSAAAQSPSSVPGTLPDETSAPAAPAATPAQPAAAAPPPPVQVASNEPPPAAATPAPAEAVASEPAPQQPAPQQPRTDAMGFASSSAPPLDPSVGQFVPAQVVNRYQQTQMASIAPVYGYSTLSAGTVGTRAAVVTFNGDKTVLDEKARGLIKAAADAFMARGTGYIRVVGHASSRSMDVSAERHMELDFDHSQARATAVAQALIKAGVPADKVLVEAVGDNTPVRTAGGDADRSAEIFIQG